MRLRTFNSTRKTIPPKNEYAPKYILIGVYIIVKLELTSIVKIKIRPKIANIFMTYFKFGNVLKIKNKYVCVYYTKKSCSNDRNIMFDFR